MYKGGYQIIDIEGVEFATGTAANVPNIYETVEGNYGKPLLLSAFTLDNTEYSGCWVQLTASDSNYTGTVYGKTITIANGDNVTFAESE